MALKWILSALLSTCLVVGLAGCSSKEDKAAESAIAMVNELADRLSKIKNEADYNSAKPDLENIARKMQPLLSEFGKQSSADQEALEKKFGPAFEKAQGRIQSEIQRLVDVVGHDVLLDMAEVMIPN